MSGTGAAVRAADRPICSVCGRGSARLASDGIRVRRTWAVEIAGRRLEPTEVFDTYWHAAERYAMYLRRLTGEPTPWTDHAILRDHGFTNAYRAADRVSQFLIREVIYGVAATKEADLVFRILLFKTFNRIEMWRGRSAPESCVARPRRCGREKRRPWPPSAGSAKQSERRRSNDTHDDLKRFERLRNHRHIFRRPALLASPQ